jgi:hypothetical protein
MRGGCINFSLRMFIQHANYAFLLGIILPEVGLVRGSTICAAWTSSLTYRNPDSSHRDIPPLKERLLGH